jgi:3-deoxy-D-manno-octulosonic-acid transferase
MRIIYKAGIAVYFFLVLIASIFNDKARRWITGRRGMWKKLKQNIEPGKDLYWFHCSSLGEFEQGRPIIEEIREREPDCFILLTFFSPSGYELRKNYVVADYVSYLPLDTRFNAWRFINLVKPKAVYFIKYEFWYYFLRTLFKKRIPVFLVSAKFREDQAFFKWYGVWYRRLLNNFTLFFVQDEGTKNLLEGAGYTNVKLTGDTRFDRVYQISQKAKSYPGIEEFRHDKLVLIAGSTWDKDEELLIKCINNSDSSVKFILAPHEINSRKLYKLVEQIEYPVVRFTDEDKTAYSQAKVLLIDTIGNLSSAYKYGSIAYIGGGFGKGIHNILEAATYGLPVIFGPNFSKFNEAREMLEIEAAFSISDYVGLNATLQKLLKDNAYLQNCSEKSRNYVESRIGATHKIVNESLKSMQ